MLQPGMVIGERYEIVDTVGSGGMSVVYRAKDYRLNRYVAMKVLKDEFSNDKTFVNKFKNEAQAAAGLSHPNIVNVYDVGEDNGNYYIVMELVEGITLKEYIHQKGRLSVAETVNFATQIAAGLEVAHEKHIVHRDIKPQNIIVSPQGVLKVTDFGIARAANSATVSANTAIGSVHYISPEQARGGYSDEKSDIYSLGITMYEMVTGRVPFEGENDVAVALAHIQNEMVAPREYYPDILPSLELVIAKCTQKKPEYRYLTANALIADLRRVEADPSGSFVHIASFEGGNDPTVVMPEKDVQTIKEAVSGTDRGSSQPFKTKTPEKSLEEEKQLDEGNDEEAMSPKLEKLVVVLGVVTALIVLAAAIFIVIKVAGSGSTKKEKKAETTTEQVEMIKVPDVKGSLIEDAKQKIEDAGLKYSVTEVNDDTVEEGKVVKQSPSAGTSVKSNSTVEIQVSSGTEKIEVPNVRNYTESEADNMITEKGFKVSHSYDYSETVASGKVISQTPASGTTAAKGTTIQIVVSKGKEVSEIKVPNLLGMTLTKAQSSLESSKLKLGSTKQEYSDKYEKGQVMAQSYASGTKVNSGTKVDITVSKGPKPKTVTKYIGNAKIENCFPDGVTSGHVKIILTQNGLTKPIFDKTIDVGSFPLVLSNVEGVAEGTGVIEVYVDGERQVTGSIVFSAVTEKE